MNAQKKESLTLNAIKSIDWQSPNTHVFFGVQVIGTFWFLWLISQHFFSASPLPLANVLTIIAMIVVRYYVGMWFVTAWRHRYFAHRSFTIHPKFKWIENVVAVICSGDAQRGVCQWAAEHIWHHQYSDQPEDHHSCAQKGLQWCHWLWVVKKGDERFVKWSLIPLLARSRVLRWIENRQWIGIFLIGGIFSLIGAFLHVGGFQSFFANFVFALCAHFFATTLLWHGTFLINSAMHLFGRQKYPTGDESRNSYILSLLTLGEAFHNNHHWDYPSLMTRRTFRGTRQGKPSERYWQGKTWVEKCFDWSGISIWFLIKCRLLQAS